MEMQVNSTPHHRTTKYGAFEMRSPYGTVAKDVVNLASWGLTAVELDRIARTSKY